MIYVATCFSKIMNLSEGISSGGSKEGSHKAMNQSEIGGNEVVSTINQSEGEDSSPPTGSERKLPSELMNLTDTDDKFVDMAVLVAKKSQDPETKVGACIVSPDKELVARAYNSMPEGGESSNWARSGSKYKDKLTYVVHAVTNAIARRNCTHLQNCTLYVNLFPCNECVKQIIQNGIKEVVYVADRKDDEERNRAAKRMLDKAGVKYRQRKTEEKVVTNLIEKKLVSIMNQSEGITTGGSEGSPINQSEGKDSLPQTGEKRKLPSEPMNLKYTDDKFMAMAVLVSKKSQDPETKVGACIVSPDKELVAIGYNSMPEGCEDISWDKDPFDMYKNKLTYVVHAETNALARRNRTYLQNCTLYVSLFPCNECAKQIIQNGIKEVVYAKDPKDGKKRNKAAKCMFDRAGVKYRWHFVVEEDIKNLTEKTWELYEEWQDSLPPSKKAKSDE